MPKKKQTPVRGSAGAKQVIRAQRSPLQRFLMHPTSLFGLLVMGVVLAGVVYRVAATDYDVHAMVPAPPLQVGAVITTPLDGQKFTTRPIMVSGSCSNDSYVKLSRNDTFSGVAICDDGKFEIQTDLFTGVNDLQAQAYNITDQPGPVTAIVHIVYDLPSAVTSTISNPVPPAAPEAGSLPLVLSSEYYFNVVTTSERFEWTLQYHTGTPPFDTQIDWGDTQKTTMTVPDNNEFKISHSYEKRGYYPITVTGSDKLHRKVTMQLVAFIKQPGDPATNGNIMPQPGDPTTTAGAAKNSPASGGQYKWLAYALPTYVVIVVMLFSFWLGERREFLILAKAVPVRVRVRRR